MYARDTPFTITCFVLSPVTAADNTIFNDSIGGVAANMALGKYEPEALEKSA